MATNVEHSPDSTSFQWEPIIFEKKPHARCVSFHPTDPILACGLYDGRVAFLKGSEQSRSILDWKWDENDNLQIGGYKGSIEWNVDGTQLAAGCYKGTVVVLRYPNGELVYETKDSSEWPKIYWNSYNCDVLAIKNGSEVQVWSSSSQNHLIYKYLCPSEIWDVEWIAENLIACGCSCGLIEILKVDENNPTNRLTEFGHEEAVRAIAFNKELQLLASCSGDKRIKVWSVGTANQPVYELQTHSYCRSLAWSPTIRGTLENPNLIACGLYDGSIVTWTPSENSDPEQILDGHYGYVNQVLFSPNGKFLASNAYERELNIWSTETWNCMYKSNGTFWINSWDATSCKLAVIHTKAPEDKELQVIEFVSDQKRKRTNERVNSSAV